MNRLAIVLPLLALVYACGAAESPSDTAVEGVAVTSNPVPVANTPSGPFAPRDDCAGMPGAVEFRAALSAAVAARDANALVALADSKVRLGFGGIDGAANMRSDFSQPDGGMWDELTEVIALGCATNEQGDIIMPRYFAQDTGGDPFETLIVTGEKVPLHRSPDDASPHLASISWDAVDLVLTANDEGVSTFGGPDETGWVQVRTRGARPVEGYMRESQLRSVVDYRLIASKAESGYRITALLAGD